MWMRLANIGIWFFVRFLAVFTWSMQKLLKKEQFVQFLAGLAQIFAHAGRASMLQAISFAIENQIDLGADEGESTDEQESEEEEEDDGPALNDLAAMVALKGKNQEPPTFKGEDGDIIPPCYDPLPEYVVFEALFNQKYGRHGKCPIVVMGKAHIYSCRELYDLLKKISEQENASPAMRGLYGTVMSVIVHRYGSKLDAKVMN